MEFVDWQQQAAEFLAADKYDEAIELYEQCIEANQNFIFTYWNLGLALLLQGQELEAQSLWLSVIVQGEPDQADRWTVELIQVLEAEGLHRLQSGKAQQAEKIYWQILELNPNNIEAHKNLGNAFLNQDKLEEAIACYQEAIALEPNYDLPYYNLGLVFQKQGKVEEAIAYYQKYLTLNPNDATTYNNLGTIFYNQGKVEKAIGSYQHCLILNPGNAMAHNNLGTIFYNQGKVEEAIACYQQALTLDPKCAKAYNNLSVIFLERCQIEEAMACFNRVIEVDPLDAEAHLNRALILLRVGEWERGFYEYEWRWRRAINPPRPFPQTLWKGEYLEGRTILLHAEQGFGDAIQFIRYAPLVAQRGGHVIVECYDSLVPLLTTVAGINQLVAVGANLPQFDVYAPLLSLPYIFGTTLETVPVQIPYIHSPQASTFKLQTPPTAYLKVGFVWAGSPQNPDDRNRSCPLNYFLPVLNVPNIAFYSLQKEPQVAELAGLSCQIQIQDLNSQLNDFADTAAIIEQLDLIITVDTAVAHLAGALGRPVWVLLSFNPDWRWMLGREDSPWYPNMRLFRQKEHGNWAELLARVAEALKALVNSKFSSQVR